MTRYFFKSKNRDVSIKIRWRISIPFSILRDDSGFFFGYVIIVILISKDFSLYFNEDDDAIMRIEII